MRREEARREICTKSSHKTFWYIAGGAVLAVVAYGVVTSLHDIRRYLNMVRM